jgi:penicillin amidase
LLLKEGAMRGLRVILVIVLVLIIVGSAAVLFVRTQIRSGWPRVDGEMRADGLLSPVEVVRDKMGVPHIYADNSHDLFFA